MAVSSLEVTAFCHVSGPLFEHGGAALDGWGKDTRQAIAEHGVKYLKAWPFKSSKGGGFQANLRIVSRGSNALAIPGPAIKGVTWSPWLEGITERNASTGFGGYHLFRKTAERLQGEAHDLAEKELQKYLPKLGG